MAYRQSSSECAACGYDLSGLGEQGRCPECGEAFNQTSGEGLRGGPRDFAERQRRSERLARRLRTLALAGLAVVVLGCGGLGTLIADDWRYPMGTALLVAAVAVLAAVTSFFSEKDEAG